MVSHGRAAARRAGERLMGELKDAVESTANLAKAPDATLENQGPEPPVVARLIVEIRSDGSRTIARGALEDATTDQKVAIRAEGTTPAQLARSLAGSLLTLPLFAAKVAENLKNAGSAPPAAPVKHDGDRRD